MVGDKMLTLTNNLFFWVRKIFSYYKVIKTSFPFQSLKQKYVAELPIILDVHEGFLVCFRMILSVNKNK